MEKNYYEILEVDVKASKEMIDKAFKLLAKRYHPDTQPDDKKEWAETNFKKINEAYEILSNEDSRKEYDTELDYEKNSAFEALCTKNEHLENLVNLLQNELTNLKEHYKKQDEYANSHDFENKTNINNTKENLNNTQNSYYTPDDSYVYYNVPINKNIDYYYKIIINKVKDLIAFIITILSIIGIITLLWKIPFTHNILSNLYNENSPLKSIVDFVLYILGHK